MLKGFEAAGFSWVQVHAPPRAMLCDRDRLLRHATALRSTLETCGLHLVLHAPDDLSAGAPEHDRALDGLLDHAAACGARFVVYHGANFPVGDGRDAAARVRERTAHEEASLRARVARLERLGITLAIENLAPVFPGPPRLCHSPGFVRDLVERLDSPRVGLLFDVGHAHIAGDEIGAGVRELLEPVADSVVLFHVHDNLGARRRGASASSLDPLRLDLHLAPGGGRLPWHQLAPAMIASGAPLVLEVHPPHRPDPLPLAAVTAEVLLRERRAPAGSRSALRGLHESAVPPG
jgi:sugar phosphate isomerase/epimerase